VKIRPPKTRAAQWVFETTKKVCIMEGPFSGALPPLLDEGYDGYGGNVGVV
jgi:hypothetical protein